MWLYLFWHTPRPEVEARAYEAMLLAFQARLTDAARAADLDLAAATARAPGLPWRPEEAVLRTYEDAYTVESMADLERLDRLAVEGAMRASHDSTAALAMAGQGGLYRALARAGAPDPAAVWSTWVRKPDGAAYPPFEAGLEARAAEAGGRVWRRTMVLSPAPEYLIRSVEPVAGVAAVVAVCRRVPVAAPHP